MTPPGRPEGFSGAGPFAAVLFDFDGTLIDTTDLIFQSYQHALQAEIGVRARPEELFAGYGRPLPVSFRAILGERGDLPAGAVSDDLIERLTRAYRTFNQEHHDRLTRPFPGVREMLEALRASEVPLGLVTSKMRAMALRGLNLIAIADYFDTLVFMEDSTRHKPSPDPLWLALDRLGLRSRAGDVVYVGDSIHDVAAGQAADLQTGAALWGPFPEDMLRRLAPTYLLATPGELVSLATHGSVPRGPRSD